MAMIADRMKLIDASGIRKVFDLAAKLKDPLNLSIGQPDYDVPESVKEAAIAAIRAGNNKYTQTQGIGELRDRIASDLAAQFKVAKPDVLITSGTSGGLLLALMEPIPRMRMVPALEAGSPLEDMTCTPGVVPANALVTLVVIFFSMVFESTSAAEPVKDLLVDVP